MYFIDFLSHQPSADWAELKSLSNVKHFRFCLQNATCDGFLPTLSRGLRGEMVDNPKCVNTRPDPKSDFHALPALYWNVIRSVRLKVDVFSLRGWFVGFALF